ncbi:hypothetical protein GC194_05030 [bacterium]|nr:hypothetical protein [bacterium]
MKLEAPFDHAPQLTTFAHAPLLWNQIYQQLRLRNITAESLVFQSFMLFGDQGIANSEYSLKPKNYTLDLVLKADSGQLFTTNQEVYCFDISVDRYFESLDLVETIKIGRAQNFLLGNALEPHRLLAAIDKGKELVSPLHNSPIYLTDAGAGNDLCCEALIKSLYSCTASLAHVVAANKATLNKNYDRIAIDDPHPFSHLERFGGYETATLVGMLVAGIEQGNLMFVEGWSAIAAAAVVLKMFPQAAPHIVFVAIEQHGVLAEFVNQLAINSIFSHMAPTENAFYLQATEGLLRQILASGSYS